RRKRRAALADTGTARRKCRGALKPLRALVHPSGMNRIYLFAASLLIAGTSLAAPVDPAIAFVHVNVVPMDRERTLRDQTVLVRGDRIVAVGSEVAIPPDAERIDGHGKSWLSPGLADMHTHSQTKNDLAIYLAHGVT